MGDPAVLASKLREETEELIQALQAEGTESEPGDEADKNGAPAGLLQEVIHEAADLLYFTLVAAASRGVGVDALRRELAQRSLRVRRRPMASKPAPEVPGEPTPEGTRENQ